MEGPTSFASPSARGAEAKPRRRARLHPGGPRKDAQASLPRRTSRPSRLRVSKKGFGFTRRTRRREGRETEPGFTGCAAGGRSLPRPERCWAWSFNPSQVAVHVGSCERLRAEHLRSRQIEKPGAITPDSWIAALLHLAGKPDPDHHWLGLEPAGDRVEIAQAWGSIRVPCYSHAVAATRVRDAASMAAHQQVSFDRQHLPSIFLPMFGELAKGWSWRRNRAAGPQSDRERQQCRQSSFHRKQTARCSGCSQCRQRVVPASYLHIIAESPPTGFAGAASPLRREARLFPREGQV
jgi:hypothetical protein